ncbi:hypothetical protein [Nonomuraea recticatena]|uniref:hypothetical protein n=1 Tax=Nonomuraea recticatena TaxID=46178 RepID=UPI0036151A9D
MLAHAVAVLVVDDLVGVVVLAVALDARGDDLVLLEVLLEVVFVVLFEGLARIVGRLLLGVVDGFILGGVVVGSCVLDGRGGLGEAQPVSTAEDKATRAPSETEREESARRISCRLRLCRRSRPSG